MGMAAGQARFLGLTARKNNVEFEGQQINQQRTTLSNQSASYNNQLLGLKVPTAPSVESFTKTVYSWSENGGTTTNTITNMVPKQGTINGYEINYSYPYTSNEGYQTANTATITYSNSKFKLGDKELQQASTSELAALRAKGDTTTNFLKYTDDNQVVSYFSEKELLALLNRNDSDAGYKTGLNTSVNYDPQSGDYSVGGQVLSTESDPAKLALLRTTANDPAAVFLKYTDANNNVNYLSETELKALMQRNDADPSNDLTSTNNAGIYRLTDATANDLNITNSATVYKIGAHTETKIVENESVTIDIDASGRLTNLTKNGKSYALTAKTQTDESSYNDAMNQYEYSVNEYNKRMNDINAKIDIIQSQDKSLELKLKQCDTEQEAISQEMDAVKKVIDKNIESTFKTFG